LLSVVPTTDPGVPALNERLRNAIDASEHNEISIAERLCVDPKTVERWVAGRAPYPRYRRSLAALLNTEEKELWPLIRRRQEGTLQDQAKVQAVYAHRWAVPREVWLHHFGTAVHHIDILAYAALFLAEDRGILRTLTEKARAGVRVRILLGQPDSPHVTERGADEGIDDAITAKIRNALALFDPVISDGAAEIKLHSTTLYASIYRADGDILVNTHTYGSTASHAPVFHVRHTAPGDIAETYLTSFECVWKQAESHPTNGEDA
jgi:hypothetical protein